uniref:Uncharacterized protein n=1 Tax=Astyanax mexicanus TaxID=7994 RepID=A0A8B9L158_ASTMX
YYHILRVKAWRDELPFSGELANVTGERTKVSEELANISRELAKVNRELKQTAVAGRVSSVQTETGWEVVIDKKGFRVWRRPIEGSHLFEYRVFGSYTDITPRQFFNVQVLKMDALNIWQLK